MIIITIFAVSMDAYIAGITLGAGGRVNELKLLYISSFSFLFPAAAILFTSFLPDDSWLNVLAACILILLGVKGLLPEAGKKDALPIKETKNVGFGYMTLLGVSLSVDSALGAATLYDQELAFALPFLLLFTHFFLLYVGRFTARLLGLAEGVSRAASGLLILIGVLRLILP